MQIYFSTCVNKWINSAHHWHDMYICKNEETYTSIYLYTEVLQVIQHPQTSVLASPSNSSKSSRESFRGTWTPGVATLPSHDFVWLGGIAQPAAAHLLSHLLQDGLSGELFLCSCMAEIQIWMHPFPLRPLFWGNYSLKWVSQVGESMGQFIRWGTNWLRCAFCSVYISAS